MSYIDFHSHVLPGADHGSDSVETSLWQLAASKKAGVKTLITTPHFYPHRHKVEGFIERRDKAYSELKKARSDNETPMIVLGAEVLLCEGLENLPSLDMLTLEGTRTILLELPYSSLNSGHIKSVEALIYAGYKIVLAHADRYDPENIEKLLELGTKIQLNASSLSKLFVKKHVTSWVERGLVVAIGSDIHGKDIKAYKKFSRAIKRLGAKADSIMKNSELFIK
jgi:protein-tyrosine phosphatase